eukprot:tig00020734_g13578.t1
MADERKATPRSDEVEEYARYLGIDPEAEPALLWIAETGLTAPLPEGWHEHVSPDGYKYYSLGTMVQWQHPLDRAFKDLVKEFRERQQRGGEDASLVEALAARRVHQVLSPARGHAHAHRQSLERARGAEAPSPAAPAPGGPGWDGRLRNGIGRPSRRRVLFGTLLLGAVMCLSALLLRDLRADESEGYTDEDALSGSGPFFSGSAARWQGEAAGDGSRAGAQLYSTVLEGAAGKTVEVAESSAARPAAAAGLEGRVPVPVADASELKRLARRMGVLAPSQTDPEFHVILNQGPSRGLVVGHLRRETPVYDTLRAAAAAWPAALVLDVGANHGCYALYAAALGLSVVAIELQEELARMLALSAAANGVGDRIVVLHRAAMDGDDERSVRVRSGWIGEDGATATPLEVPGGDTRSLRLDSVPTGEGPIAFVKVDVEGYEIRALRSAARLLASRRVKNVIIEFGPPGRWTAAGSSPEAARELLTAARDEYGFEVRVVNSYCYGTLREALPEGAERQDKPSKVSYLLVDKGETGTLLQTMAEAVPKSNGECYVWLHLPPG